jgi:phosphatidylglycerol:prolipoprotein diacylglycerol transferase
MSPVLLTLGEWDIPAYGFFLALALIVGWTITGALGRQDRLPVTRLGTAYVLGAVVGIVVARGSWLLQHPDHYLGGLSMLSLPPGQLAVFPGLVVALVASALYLAAHRIPPTVAWDAAAPGGAAAVLLERLGALLAGTGAGKYAPDLPWAIRFPEGSAVLERHASELSDLLAPGATESLPVHPTQVYAMGLAAIGLVLCLRWRRNREFSGQIMLAYGIYALVARIFVEEWFRADAAQAVFGPLSGAQVAAVVLIAALAAVYRARRMRAAGRNDGLRLWEGGRWSPDATSPSATPAPAATSSPGAARAGKGSPKKKRKGRKKR